MSKKIVKVIGSDHFIIGMFNRHGEYKAYNEFTSPTPDIVCFIGGADINPSLYGEEPFENRHFDTLDNRDKDAFEKYSELPKIGICRGGQFLNVMSGGSLWQDVQGHGTSHRGINLVPDILPWDVGHSFIITSDHHQVIIPSSDGEVLLIAQDETQSKPWGNSHKSRKQQETTPYDVEAVWYQNTKSLCFQPHPEYIKDSDCEKYFFKLLERIF